MKKLILLFLSFCIAATCYAGREENLYEKFKEKPHIKVYLKDVKDNTGNAEVNTKVFREIFDDTHRKRVNIKFIPVKTADEADVIVTAVIEKYKFTEKALPSILGVSEIVADSLTPKSDAELVVDYAITDPQYGSGLMEHENFTTHARRPVEDMKGGKAFEYAVRKNVNRFIYKSFRKPKDNRPL